MIAGAARATARILVVDDDHVFRVSTAALLRADGHETEVAPDGQRAAAALRERPFDLVIADLRMPGIDGVRFTEAIRLWGDSTPVLMISGVGTVADAVSALHSGVDDFLTKPVEPELLSAKVAELLERRPHFARQAPPLGTLVGRSAVMREVAAAIRKVAPTDTTVLISGETGTGKELVARAVHELSARRAGPFIPVNCASLAEGLLESELFGHVRGAFTGAVRDRRGLFEAASGGTLFLDEVGEMSPALQQRLLRALQEREVVPVGSTRAVPADVRVVAAANRDLRERVAAGAFREDLLYRLAVFEVAVPPLRERREDIPLLVEHALASLRARAPGRDRLACSPFAMRLLRAHDWPGNVRQLLAVLERAAIHADFERIGAQHLPDEIRTAPDGRQAPRYRAASAGDGERAAILAALEASGGVLSRCAELLGMGRTTLWRKLRAYGIRAD
jgi:DNA-binding NtrC family response regulator